LKDDGLDGDVLEEDAFNFLLFDTGSECEIVINSFEEEENSDCWIWEDNVLDSDVLDKLIHEDGIDGSSKDNVEVEEDIVDILL